MSGTTTFVAGPGEIGLGYSKRKSSGTGAVAFRVVQVKDKTPAAAFEAEHGAGSLHGRILASINGKPVDQIDGCGDTRAADVENRLIGRYGRPVTLTFEVPGGGDGNQGGQQGTASPSPSPAPPPRPARARPVRGGGKLGQFGVAKPAAAAAATARTGTSEAPQQAAATPRTDHRQAGDVPSVWDHDDLDAPIPEPEPEPEPSLAPSSRDKQAWSALEPSSPRSRADSDFFADIAKVLNSDDDNDDDDLDDDETDNESDDDDSPQPTFSWMSRTQPLRDAGSTSTTTATTATDAPTRAARTVDPFGDRGVGNFEWAPLPAAAAPPTGSSPQLPSATAWSRAAGWPAALAAGASPPPRAAAAAAQAAAQASGGWLGTPAAAAADDGIRPQLPRPYDQTSASLPSHSDDRSAPAPAAATAAASPSSSYRQPAALVTSAATTAEQQPEEEKEEGEGRSGSPPPRNAAAPPMQWGGRDDRDYHGDHRKKMHGGGGGRGGGGGGGQGDKARSLSPPHRAPRGGGRHKNDDVSDDHSCGSCSPSSCDDRSGEEGDRSEPGASSSGASTQCSTVLSDAHKYGNFGWKLRTISSSSGGGGGGGGSGECGGRQRPRCEQRFGNPAVWNQRTKRRAAVDDRAMATDYHGPAGKGSRSRPGKGHGRPSGAEGQGSRDARHHRRRHRREHGHHHRQHRRTAQRRDRGHSPPRHHVHTPPRHGHGGAHDGGGHRLSRSAAAAPPSSCSPSAAAAAAAAAGRHPHHPRRRSGGRPSGGGGELRYAGGGGSGSPVVPRALQRFGTAEERILQCKQH
jgi:hypothetical protein